MSAAVRQSQKQLALLQKNGQNKWCFECKTSSPQWASPKYGIFICLECAGTHRSLGVHISFVRSVTMDQFKPEELKLMEVGGNEKAEEFFKENGIDDSVSIVDKYNSTVAEDYREKLAAEARGEEWTRRDRPVHVPNTQSTNQDKFKEKGTFSPSTSASSQSGTNAFQQFRKTDEIEPTLNELASDALGAISTGWGWFSKTVTKTVAETTDTYIRPSMRQFAESEVGGNARRAVEQFSRKAREAGAYSAEQFNKYAVEALGNDEISKTEFAHLFDGWKPRSISESEGATLGSSAEVSAETSAQPRATFRSGDTAESKTEESSTDMKTTTQKKDD